MSILVKNRIRLYVPIRQNHREIHANQPVASCQQTQIHLTSGLIGTLKLFSIDNTTSANYIIIGHNSCIDAIQSMNRNTEKEIIKDVSGASILIPEDGIISSFICMIQLYPNDIPEGNLYFEIWKSEGNDFRVLKQSKLDILIEKGKENFINKTVINEKVSSGDCILVTVRYFGQDVSSFMPKYIKSTIVLN